MRLRAKFTPRDFINVGIFAAVYLALAYAAGLLGILGPALWLISFVIGALVNGVTVMLFFTRIRSPWVFTIFGGVLALLFFLIGTPPHTVITFFVLAVIADLAAGTRRYRNRKLNVLAYAIFALWPVGHMSVVVFNREAFIEEIGASMGSGYVDAAVNIFTPQVLLIWALIQFAVALLGGFLGALLGRKHFDRIASGS